MAPVDKTLLSSIANSDTIDGIGRENNNDPSYGYLRVPDYGGPSRFGVNSIIGEDNIITNNELFSNPPVGFLNLRRPDNIIQYSTSPVNNEIIRGFVNSRISDTGSINNINTIIEPILFNVINTIQSSVSYANSNQLEFINSFIDGIGDGTRRDNGLPDLFTRPNLTAAFRSILLTGDDTQLKADTQGLRSAEGRQTKLELKKIDQIAAKLKQVYDRTQESKQRIVTNVSGLETLVERVAGLDLPGDSREVFEALLTDLLEARRQLVTSLEATIDQNSERQQLDVDQLLKSAYALLKKGEPFTRAAESLIADIYSYELSAIEQEAYLLIFESGSQARDNMYEYLNSKKKRPSVGGFDYTAEFATRYQGLVEFQKDYAFYQNANEILNAIFVVGTEAAIELIEQRFDQEKEADVALLFYSVALECQKQKKLSNQVIGTTKELKRKIGECKRAIDPDYEFNERLGRNLPALHYLTQQFRSAVVPLYQTLVAQADPEEMEAVFGAGAEGVANRDKFVIRLRNLAEQRDMTEIERDYFASVELLSAFNPHLVALLKFFPGETSVYVESYLKSLSDDTFDGLEDGQYVPIVQLGLGPGGVASAGEIARKRPDLAAECLYVDLADMPGGPFAVPRGPAWNMNSASSYGDSTLNLPDVSADEEKTVRAYGSSLRWFPGERANDKDVREGSINLPVDFMPSPDSISTGRYPDNEEFARLLQLVTSMVARKIALNTEIVDRQEVDDDRPGDTVLTLKKTYLDGSTVTKRVRTDNFVIAGGGGEDYYGFDLSNTRAEALLKAQRDLGGFPRLSSTLNAFEALASRDKNKALPGKTIVIYGAGNSCDTLVEYISALFENQNSVVRSIEKIIIVTDGELSQRPRYGSIFDVRARNGSGNLVEIVPGRVSDVDFVNSAEGLENAQLALFKRTASGEEELITDSNGNPIEADAVIAATGFRNSLLEKLGIDLADLEDVTLPTSPNVSVAQRLKNRSGTVVVGTAAPSAFKVIEKLLQLPKDAREALLRNGPENAVAVGFRNPETQAAIRLLLDQISQPEKIVDSKTDLRAEVTIANTESDLRPVVSIDQLSEDQRPSGQNDVMDPNAVLSAILMSNLGKIKLAAPGNGDEQKPEQIVKIVVDYEKDKGFKFQTSDEQLETLIKKVVANPWFQTYAMEAMSNRRSSAGFEIQLNFKWGILNTQKTFVEAL